MAWGSLPALALLLQDLPLHLVLQHLLIFCVPEHTRLLLHFWHLYRLLPFFELD